MESGIYRVAPALVLCIGFTTIHSVPASAQEEAAFDCLIDPKSVVDLSTREVGTVIELLVDRGDEVRVDDVVARLDDDVERATVDLATARAQMQAEIEEMETTVAFAERELDRVEGLFAKNAVSYRDRDRAATEATRAKLQLSQARQRHRVASIELTRAKRLLERRVVRSPIDGIVIEQMISPGESVENRPIVRIAKVDPLNVEVIVPVTHFGAIVEGMKAEVVPKYPGAENHAATVTVVDRVVDSASNTFGVRLELPNEDHRIPAGVRCSVRFPVPPDVAGPGS